MMISPECYVELNKDKTLPELIEEREDLCSEIKQLEQVVFAESRTGKEWQICPGPDVRYQMNLEYLAEICTYIKEKYNAEYENWGD